MTIADLFPDAATRPRRLALLLLPLATGLLLALVGAFGYTRSVILDGFVILSL